LIVSRVIHGLVIVHIQSGPWDAAFHWRLDDGLAILLIVAAYPSFANAAERIALVVGNGAYPVAATLEAVPR
jgi:hypothetical protein